MRLIDADALKNEVDNFQNCYNGWSDTYDKAYIIEAIEEAPTIDAIPKGKLIEAIKAKDFVDELIGYIFAYPDDDYMTMECLCRKLVKHGLLDKADGYYQTHDIHTNTHECVKDTHDKTEPSNSEIPNNCEPQTCRNCKWSQTVCRLGDNPPCHSYEPKTEPQGIVLPRKGCHRPIELPCHSEQGDGYCANCIYWHEDFEGVVYGKPQTDCAWKKGE